jgi:hypothetical protein
MSTEGLEILEGMSLPRYGKFTNFVDQFGAALITNGESHRIRIHVVRYILTRSEGKASKRGGMSNISDVGKTGRYRIK